MDKQNLARKIRKQRASYSVEVRLPWDTIIHDRILELTEGHSVIALYTAMNGEVDTYGIMESLFWDKTKTVCLPKTLPDHKLAFYKITSFDDLKMGAMDIMEPTTDEVVIPDLVITPLSVFNKACFRIGYGGGYYDRYFENNDVRKIGLAYSFQETDWDFQEPFDQPCDLIVTEQEVYHAA